MANLKFQNISIKGIASCVPRDFELNENYHLFSGDESKKFIDSTGVMKRHLTDEKTCTSDLCFVAAEHLIEKLAFNKESIDILIFVTQSPDYILPATSAILQNRLELSKNTACFDINLGCTGYIYGLSTAYSYLQNPNFNRALLLVGDTSSKLISSDDRSTSPLFGDGGTATLIEKSYGSTNSYFSLNTDGSGYKELIIDAGGQRNPSSQSTLELLNFDGNLKNLHHLYMNGPEIFNFTIREVPKSIKSILEFSGTSIDEMDYFIYHQANKFMIDFLAKKSKIPKEKVPIALDKYGNTSSATIPLTICSELNHKSGEKLKLLLSGFGVGLSWANAILDLENCYISNVLEL